MHNTRHLIQEAGIKINDMKVFGIGLNKTGTKTLGECMTILGFRNKSYDFQLLEYYKNHDMEGIFRVADQFDSFEDWPWPLLYRELDKKYPDAKFILTLRSTPEKWFDSLCRHAQRTGPTEARKIVYGWTMPTDSPQDHLDFYHSHYQNVVSYFSAKPEKLMIISWETEPSWIRLCSFLGNPGVPDMPFPHKNKSPEN
jgi:hypothetical protein